MNYILAPTEEYLAHSAKGTTWKDHKYIKKVNDRYIYAKDSLGITSRQNMKKHQKAANQDDKILEDLQNNGIHSVEDAADAVGALAGKGYHTVASKKYEHDYQKTPLGQFEEAVRRYGKVALNNVIDKFKNLDKEQKKKTHKASDAVTVKYID